MNVNVYGPRLATARKLAGLTQETLADRLGVNVQSVKRKENPNGKEPKPLERIAIAAICGVSLDFIEGRIEDPEDAVDDVARKLREHDQQIASVRAELQDLAENLLRLREQSAGRPQSVRLADEDENPGDPSVGDLP